MAPPGSGYEYALEAAADAGCGTGHRRPQRYAKGHDYP